LQRSLLIAYGFTKADGWRDGGAAGGALTFSLPTLASSELNDQFKAVLPLAQHVEGWLQHIKHGAGAFSGEHMVRRYDTLIDFLCAGVEVKAQVLSPYYQQADPQSWFGKLLPEQLAADCPLALPAAALAVGSARLSEGLSLEKSAAATEVLASTPEKYAPRSSKVAGNGLRLLSALFSRKSVHI